MARLSESQALEICILRSIEEAADNGGLWTADDAREATIEARALKGHGASFVELLSRRAQWALELIARRSPDRAIRLREPRWPGVLASVLCALALVAGGLTDDLASRQQVDVLEFSLFGLIAWNVLIYLLVVAGWLRSLVAGGRQPPGLLDEIIGKLRFRSALGLHARPAPAWLMGCEAQWIALSRVLAGTRSRIAFHSAAICFATGVVLALYWRGLPVQYQPGVPGSTWLDIQLMQRLFETIVTPGARLFGLQVPEVERVAALRASGDALGLARTLFHLHAASLVVWVMLPRLGLVLVNVLHRWRLRRAFPLPLNAAYFTALRAGSRGQKIGVVVMPFRYELTPQLKANLRKLLERTYGMAVDITIQQSVLMGEDPTDWKRALHSEGHVAVLPVFTVVATAEADTHAALLRHLRAAVDAETPVLAIVDTAAFPPGQDDRLRSRQRQWRQVLDQVHAEPVFLNLARGDEQDFATLQRRLNRDE